MAVREATGMGRGLGYLEAAERSHGFLGRLRQTSIPGSWNEAELTFGGGSSP